MDWLRWYHGTTTDPKWRVVALRSKQPVHVVVSVWASFLERASETVPRGRIDGWDPETIGAALELEPGVVRAVHEGMQGKVLDGDRLTGWQQRNPKREREDPESAERAREYRERQKEHQAPESSGGANANRTPPNATERPERGEEREEEEKEKPPIGGQKKEKKAEVPIRRRGVVMPKGWEPNDKHRTLAAELSADVDLEAEKFTDWATAKGAIYRDWDAAFRNWLRNINRYSNGRSRPKGNEKLMKHAARVAKYDLTQGRSILHD